MKVIPNATFLVVLSRGDSPLNDIGLTFFSGYIFIFNTGKF
jgi:hypothetical protein